MIGTREHDAIIIVAELLFMDTIVRELGTQFIRCRSPALSYGACYKWDIMVLKNIVKSSSS